MENTIFENRVCALEKDSERNSAQHREFYTKFNDVDIKQAVSDEKYSQILTTQKSIDEKVTKMSETPSNRWNSLVNVIIGAIAGGLIAMLMNGMIG